MRFLIATHGEFSKGITDSVRLIVGDSGTLDQFSMTKSKSQESAEIEVKDYLKKYQGPDLIVLTDVFGGSVANLFTNFLLQGYEFQLVTGVNLPLLLTLVLSEEADSFQSVTQGIEEAKKGIIHVNELIQQKGGN
ncbi:MAG TPA: PTS mannose transporter subunit IIA [Candidatus Tetragenococcus pullicola]|nr:PTS mannose transporter subunit IIA [Candidatus Tetragenococcus pullicola]HLQ87771.1 PTS mannose transporter subunit IIA [Enterococcus sp.]